MDKIILCLANSYKHGGRCIAGIEVNIEDTKLSIVKSHYGIPTWIRPVSYSNAGEVPMSDAKGINVFSILKIYGVTYAGNGSHSEDYYYQRLEVIQTLNPSDTFLAQYIDSWHSTIFGNRGRALTPEAFESGDYSVMLIRTEGAEIYLDMRFEPKPRIKFSFNHHDYDFPITDPDYLEKLRNNNSLYHSDYGVLYIVASLAVRYDDWHNKLAATIIVPATSCIRESVAIQPSKPIEVKRAPVQLISQKILDPTKTTDGITRKIITPVPNLTIPPNNTFNNQPKRSSNSSSSGGCYIATSIYGSYDCPEVWTLRRYRDYTLSKSHSGRMFIKTYYAVSPSFVKWFGHYSIFKLLLKPRLNQFVYILRSKGYKSTPYIDK